MTIPSADRLSSSIADSISGSNATKVFVSCAHRGGAQLAERLRQDLKARRLEPWIDGVG